MSTTDIRAILFIVAKEFRTTDPELLEDIDSQIELTKNLVSQDLGPKYNHGVALLTAHNMKMKKYSEEGYSGAVTSEAIGDAKLTFANNKKEDNEYSEYLGSAYGEQYIQLLKSTGIIKKPVLFGVFTI